MSNEQNATPIDDQLIVITAIARAAGYDDGAAWIEKQATVFVERELAESEPFVVVGDKSNATPPSEPSRTEAVKEAIGRIGHHVRCVGGARCLMDEEPECFLMRQMRPLAAALAKAEQFRNAAEGREEILKFDLADAERKLAVVQGHYSALESQNFDLTHQLAAAEKRAKDAEDGWRATTTHPRGAFCAVFSWPHGQRCSDKAEEHYAALTRKLATVKALAQDVISSVVSGIRGHVGDHYILTTQTSERTIERWRQELAAIDAPAGEDAVANGLGVSVTPLPPSDQMCDFTYWATVPPGITKPMSRCINAKPCALHPIAPPPEPVNALPIGYEECDDCDANAEYHRNGTSHCTKCGWPASDCDGHPVPEPTNAPACKYHGAFNFFDDARGEALCSECKQPIVVEPANVQGSEFPDAEFCGDIATRADPPSAQRFTAEEARERAIADDDDAGLARHIASHPASADSFEADAVGLARTAASWRHYAAMLERDDALERAADNALIALDELGLGVSYRVREVRDNLRAVLAQRAKGRM